MHIVIEGARTHNLKNIKLKLPKNKLILITGLSGSGKSSLAFDTLYAEGQRRYVESLSAYARQFLQQMDKPDVDLIEGLSPAISIEQKATSHNPRSTVGTVTEIYDYLRLLFARIGTPNCITHNIPLSQQTVAQIVDNILKLPENSKIAILSPIVSARKGEYTELFNKIQTIGFTKVRINEVIYDINDTDTLPKLNKTQKHNIEIIIDRIKITHASNTDTNTLKDRITDSVEMALNHGNDKLMVLNLDDNKQIQLYSRKFACPSCNYSIPELEPRDFSFNSPFGACNKCDGLGMIKFLDPNKIIIDPNYSINNGVFKFWNKNNSYAYNILDAVAKYYNFDLDTPFNQLSKEIQNIIININVFIKV